jgi:hypothetical protein
MSNIRFRTFETMRASTFICTNMDEIERVRVENDKLELPNPQPLPSPEYREETAWFHPDDVQRAYTKRINDYCAAILTMAGGDIIAVKMSSEIENMLDSMFSVSPE